MNVEVRPSKPEDAKAIAPYIYSSGPYSFNCIFAGDQTVVLPYLDDAFCNGVGELGFKNHVTVVQGQQIVGCGAVLAPDPPRRQTVTVLRHIVSHFGLLRSAGIIRRGLAFERIVQPPVGDLWIIAHLGVAAEQRGNGIGEKLMRHLIDSIRRQGGKRVGLDVAVINPKAEALYKRFGFEVTGHRKSNLSNQHGTVPDFHRMEMTL